MYTMYVHLIYFTDMNFFHFLVFSNLPQNTSISTTNNQYLYIEVENSHGF